MQMRQTESCWYCGKPETVEPVELHHVERRSQAPERIHDPNNVAYLCRYHHRLTETSEPFYRRIQELWKHRA